MTDQPTSSRAALNGGPRTTANNVNLGWSAPILVWHTRTVVRECCKGDDASQWENGKLATPEPLNRSSQKVAHVITSWISTDMQNVVAIPPGVSFPRMREIAHQNVTRLLFLGSSNELQTRRLNRFSRAIRQTTPFRARMCLFGVRRQTFNIYTP